MMIGQASMYMMLVWLKTSWAWLLLQTQHQLGLCCNVATYAPLEQPASWQQQRQQQEELVVPDLPDLWGLCSR
jgi:hypothetical protein